MGFQQTLGRIVSSTTVSESVQSLMAAAQTFDFLMGWPSPLDTIMKRTVGHERGREGDGGGSELHSCSSISICLRCSKSKAKQECKRFDGNERSGSSAKQAATMASDGGDAVSALRSSLSVGREKYGEYLNV